MHHLGTRCWVRWIQYIWLFLPHENGVDVIEQNYILVSSWYIFSIFCCFINEDKWFCSIMWNGNCILLPMQKFTKLYVYCINSISATLNLAKWIVMWRTPLSVQWDPISIVANREICLFHLTHWHLQCMGTEHVLIVTYTMCQKGCQLAFDNCQ